ncbi:ead/Ea22-like family protein [Yersinia enterocolitica]
MNNIEELKKVALAATPGPWVKCDSYGPNENGTCISAVERPDLMIASTTGYYGRVGGIANTHFIALANPAVILDLIAQLEAAQKERDALKMKLSDAGCLLVEWKQRVEQSERRANTLEAALSAANEKLSKPVVLPEVVVVNISGKYPIEVMYASKVKTFLKAAGFTVEGE